MDIIVGNTGLVFHLVQTKENHTNVDVEASFFLLCEMSKNDISHSSNASILVIHFLAFYWIVLHWCRTPEKNKKSRSSLLPLLCVCGEKIENARNLLFHFDVFGLSLLVAVFSGEEIL